MTIECPKCQTHNPESVKFCGECGTLLEADVVHTQTLETPIQQLTRGTVFASRYEIIEELGKGGMGKVYRVEDTKVKEEVALKLIKPEIAADKKTIERFRNELKTARKIRHKNVCAMFDLSEEKGSHFITMEYVSGGDLKKFIRRAGHLNVGRAISISKQICEGLSEAHRLGIVHRDLKPNNIMIDDEGNARIMDFGIARTVKEKGITGSGVMIGTPEYMSPEQAEAKEVDLRSDIYSLGIVLYEMTTGRLPFEGETSLAIAMKHKGETPKNPKEFNPQIPDDLSGAILKCLEKERENRFQTADELHSELERIEQGLPTTDRVVPKKKPLTSREITVQLNVRKLLITVLAVLALLVIGLFLLHPWSRQKPSPIPTDKPSLAVVYFSNNTGDESLDHYRINLPQWLITDLNQSKYLRVMGSDRLLNVLRNLNLVEARSYDRQDLINIAREGSVDNILQASLSKFGNLLRIDYTLQKISTGESVGTGYVSGKSEESFPDMVDELTKKIKENLKLSAEKIAGDIDKQIGKITTSSPEALKLYWEGGKFHEAGEYHKAIEIFKEAIDLDPEFATAFRSMATAYGNMGYIAEKRKYLQKAMDLSDRVTDREFYRTQADFYKLSEKTYDKAIEAYKKLIELYPEDVGGHNGLGLLYADLEEWDKAIEQYEIPIQNNTASQYPYGNQAVAYKAKGLYAKSREVLENYIKNFSDRASYHRQMANSYLCQNQYDQALAEIDKAFVLSPTESSIIFNKGNIYLCKEDLDGAETEFRKLLAQEEPRARLSGRIGLGSLYILQGRLRESIDEAEKAILLSQELVQRTWESNWYWALASMYTRAKKYEEALKEWDKAIHVAVEVENLHQQRRSLHGKGLTYIDMGLTDLAEKTAAELKKLTETSMNNKHMRFYHNLIGNIELEKNNFPKAVDYFEKAVSLLPHECDVWHLQAIFYNSLAYAYFQAGDLKKALENYERITSMTTGRLYLNDLYVKSFYKLGQIYERRGDRSKAIENYERFLDLWKDADPGIAEVEDAKQRLEFLK